MRLQTNRPEKKNIFVIILFIMALTGTSQGQEIKKIYYDSGELYSELKKTDKDKGIVESLVFYYKDGTGKGLVMKYKSGDTITTNIMEWYPNGYPNGKVKTSYTLLNGLKDGQYLSNYFDGSTKEYGIYKNGMESGLFVTYYPNKMFMSKINWVEGNLDGGSIYYYPDNKVFQSGKYKEGKKVGEWIIYDKYGKETEKKIFDDNGILINN